MHTITARAKVRLVSQAGVLLTLQLALLTPIVTAQTLADPSPGIAWQVKGSWLIDGRHKPIVTGDSIPAGSLLQPGHPPANSIIVLLPDGQSNLYECFTAEDCARGFRVPALQQVPQPSTTETLARIRATLLRGNRGLSPAADLHLPVGSPRDEVVVALGQDNQVQIAGLAAKLPNGRYTYDLQPLEPARPPQLHRALQKSASSIALTLPSSGLYVVTIADDTGVPRIHLFLAAVSPAQEPAINQSFTAAKDRLKQWNDEFYGWPVHDFQWAFLESLMLGTASPSETNVSPSASLRRAADLAAEPVFSPKPGGLPGDTAIVVRSETPDAVIHYTVDSSQPRADSPLYTAPIVVQESGLTIKAFARAPGKKDSAVVTGVFRIRRAIPNR